MQEQENDGRILKRLVWMALTALMVTIAGIVARRLTEQVWAKVVGEPPPEAIM